MRRVVIRGAEGETLHVIEDVKGKRRSVPHEMMEFFRGRFGDVPLKSEQVGPNRDLRVLGPDGAELARCSYEESPN